MRLLNDASWIRLTVPAQSDMSIGLTMKIGSSTSPVCHRFDEQTAIVGYLDSLQTTKFDALTAEAQRAIDLLQERRTALISAAVTGKIDVRGLAESEAA